MNKLLPRIYHIAINAQARSARLHKDISQIERELDSDVKSLNASKAWHASMLDRIDSAKKAANEQRPIEDSLHRLAVEMRVADELGQHIRLMEISLDDSRKFLDDARIRVDEIAGEDDSEWRMLAPQLVDLPWV